MLTMKAYKKIQQAWKRGLTVSDISRELGHDRKTIRKYLAMDRGKFKAYLKRMAERGKCFEVFCEEILEIFKKSFKKTIYTSSVYDFLQERHGILPGNERTLRNYIMYLKLSGAIPPAQGRIYKPVENLPYGKQLQMDLGVEKTNIGAAYFMASVFAASRYRYASSQDRPFSTEDVIGHSFDAFNFFGGVPEEVVIDQDRTLLVSENGGDILLTKAFEFFVAEQGLRLWVCKAGDPETKGKVENTVKFVKTNFFSSRSFASFEELKVSMHSWVIRANARINQATRRVPRDDFETNERPALRPVRPSLFQKEAPTNREARKADKKCLISVGGSKYSVPHGYRLLSVEVERTADELIIFDPLTGEEIARHTIPMSGGMVIVKKEHYFRENSRSLEEAKGSLLDALPEVNEWKAFIERMWNERRRYFRSQYAKLMNILEGRPEHEELREALRICSEHGLITAAHLAEVLSSRRRYGERGEKLPTPQLIKSVQKPPEVSRRPIAAYEKLLATAKGIADMIRSGPIENPDESGESL